MTMTLQNVLLGLYGAFIALYSYVLLPVVLLLAWKGARLTGRWIWERISRIRGVKRPNSPSRRRAIARRRGAAGLSRSLVFNVILAASSTVAAFAVLAESPLTVDKKLAVAPLIAAVLPYLWGFSTTASVGNHSGMSGVLVGLFWLSYRSHGMVWFDHAPYFFVVNLIAQASGWLGAVAGQGQTRESVVVSVFSVEAQRWRELWRALKRAIRRGVSGISRELLPRMVQVETPAREVIADWEAASSAVDYSQSVQWRERSCPQLELWRWFRGIDTHSVDEILDRATCFLRFLIVKAQVKAAHGGNSEMTRTEAVITVFLETSTIVHADNLCARLGAAIHGEVQRALRRGDYRSLEEYHAIVRKWEGEPNIEQNAKHTTAVTHQGRLGNGAAVSTAQAFRLNVLVQALATETLFDRFRGKRVTFVVVLAFQIVLGLAVNWASSSLGQH